MTYTVEIPFTFEVRLANPEGLARVEQIFLEEMRAAVGDCVLHVQERVKLLITGDDLIFTSHLLNSIASAVVLNGLMISGAVGTNVKYAKYQEFGTVPHFVPFHIAPSLYDEAQRKWGWVKPDMRTRGGKALKGADSTKLWLKPGPNAKPMWGVVVSGRKRPYLFPGWQLSLPFITSRLQTGARAAAARINGGG